MSCIIKLFIIVHEIKLKSTHLHIFFVESYSILLYGLFIFHLGHVDCYVFISSIAWRRYWATDWCWFLTFNSYSATTKVIESLNSYPLAYDIQSWLQKYQINPYVANTVFGCLFFLDSYFVFVFLYI